MSRRIESPSSINIYRQCPRKYFYQYIQKLTTKTNIHLIRGSAVHSVLENFFNLDISKVNPENYEFELKTLLLDMFRQEWEKARPQLNELDMNIHDKLYYYSDSKKMFDNWFDSFMQKLKTEMENKSLVDAFNHLTPIREKHYISETHRVRGYIDAIHEWADGVHILDYKTSSRDKMSDDYRLQLGIYAMLYKQEHGKAPKKVGINFLKFGEKYIEVDDNLIKEAEEECNRMKERTVSDEAKDYPKQQSGLCKWSTGQCDFYENCIKDKR